MGSYVCECNDRLESCNIHFENDETWEREYENVSGGICILHPNCPNLEAYDIVEVKDDCVLGVEKQED
jgi:hypothetical protein